MAQRSAWVYIGLFLITGTFSVVTSKFIYQTEAKGRNGDVHVFSKPWAMNFAMFGGMLFCIPYDIISKKWKARSKTNNAMSRRIATNSGDYTSADKHRSLDEVLATTEEETKVSKLFVLVFLPALCDLVSTYMMNVGMLKLPASIWQMLRGSIVVFTAAIRVLWLKKHTHNYEWMGVFIVVVGLLAVGGSQIATNTSESDSDEGLGDVILAFSLVVIAQGIQALQTVIEERLLHDVKASSAMIVGIEGFWGFLLAGAICLPVAQMLPGKDGDGLHEDSIDTWRMISNSDTILYLVLFYVVIIALFNLFGMYVTEITQATTRNIMESLRTASVWVFSICLYYWYSTSKGEELTYYSLLELGGFLILVFGLFTYYRVVRVPCIKYAIEFQPILDQSQDDKV